MGLFWVILLQSYKWMDGVGYGMEISVWGGTQKNGRNGPFWAMDGKNRINGCVTVNEGETFVFPTNWC